MGKSLIIVESDAKSKTIKRFLGKDFTVRASVGHIKNLPKNRLGVDIEGGFEPEYITIRGRGKILKDIKKLAGTSDTIYLATDPDREGEAIASHLADELKKTTGQIKRVTFNEITEKAVQEAVQKAHLIDIERVEAQKARRVMDRLVGYEVSPILWQTIYRGLSAGRVQSVTLRLICEREDAINAFDPKEYWSLEADFHTKKDEEFRSKLVKINYEDIDICSESEMQSHVNALPDLKYTISDKRAKTVERRPYPPYTTSTFQQDAARRLNMTTRQIMAIAQQLYEGIDLPEGRVGLITYMRTDSTRLAQSAVEEVRQYIAESYGLEYVPEKPKFYKSKKSAQDAHEAIRPTSVKRPPKAVASYLSDRQKKVYELIWNRFVACQMAHAKINQTTVEVTAGQYLFRTTGSVIKFRGFMQLYSVDIDQSETAKIPKDVHKGDRVTLDELYPEQHFTKPPPRYNESSLVKELDNLGIGRPSTYALIISTLLDRKYVEREARSLKPTELGITVKTVVVQQFPNIFNVDFTAKMEAELDQIESGKKERVAVLNHFYTPFKSAVHEALEKKEEIKESLQEETDDQCPDCRKELVVKWGRNGRFIACSGYPECRYTKPLEEDVVEIEDKCDKCGAGMVLKTGRFGRFLACSSYPDCKFTKPVTTGISCPEPECKGQLVEKRSKRGKTFYGCSSYPDCKFATWYKPVKQACLKCGFGFIEERYTQKKGAFVRCPNCKVETELEN